MVMREHRLGFFRSCISVCHQQGRPFLASLDLPVERIEAVYYGFELRRESEVITLAWRIPPYRRSQGADEAARNRR